MYAVDIMGSVGSVIGSSRNMATLGLESVSEDREGGLDLGVVCLCSL